MEIIHSDGKVYRITYMNSCKAAFAMQDKHAIDNFVTYIRGAMQLKHCDLMHIACKYMISAVKAHGRFNRDNIQVLEELSDFMEKFAYCQSDACCKSMFELSKVILNCSFEDCDDTFFMGVKEIWRSVRRLSARCPQDIELLEELIQYEVLLEKNKNELDYFWHFKKDITMAFYEFVRASDKPIEYMHELVDRLLAWSEYEIDKWHSHCGCVEGMDKSMELLLNHIACAHRMIRDDIGAFPMDDLKVFQNKLDLVMGELERCYQEIEDVDETIARKKAWSELFNEARGKDRY